MKENEFASIQPHNVRHEEEKKMIYVERKKLVFLLGGDVDYVVRTKYLLNDTVIRDYYLEREKIPAFRKYLEKKGQKTTLHRMPKDVGEIKKQNATESNLKHPGFTLQYKGNKYDHCLVYEPTKDSNSFIICTTNKRFKVAFTLPGTMGFMAQSRVRVIDSEIYKWLKENDLIQAEYEKSLYGKKEVPEVKLNISKMMEKGRLGKLSAKEEIFGKKETGEDHILLAYMLPEVIKARIPFEDKIREADFKLSYAEEFGNEEEIKKYQEVLNSLLNERDKALLGAIKEVYVKRCEGAVFVRRYCITSKYLQECKYIVEDKEGKKEEKDGYNYSFATDTALAGWHIIIDRELVEPIPNEEYRHYLLLEKANEVKIYKDDIQQVVPLEQVVSALR